MLTIPRVRATGQQFLGPFCVCRYRLMSNYQILHDEPSLGEEDSVGWLLCFIHWASVELGLLYWNYSASIEGIGCTECSFGYFLPLCCVVYQSGLLHQRQRRQPSAVVRYRKQLNFTTCQMQPLMVNFAFWYMLLQCIRGFFDYVLCKFMITVDLRWYFCHTAWVI